MDPQELLRKPWLRRVLCTAACLAAAAIAWLALQRRPEAVAVAPAAITAEPVAEVPLPVSVRELLANLVEDRSASSVVNGIFKGYVNLQSATPRKLRLEMSAGRIALSEEKVNGAMVTVESPEVKLFRFRNDLKSLVLGLSGGTFIYLRYEQARTLQAYPQAMATLTGWFVKAGKKITKIVLIKEIHPSWPRVESVKEISPPTLPH